MVPWTQKREKLLGNHEKMGARMSASVSAWSPRRAGIHVDRSSSWQRLLITATLAVTVSDEHNGLSLLWTLYSLRLVIWHLFQWAKNQVVAIGRAANSIRVMKDENRISNHMNPKSRLEKSRCGSRKKADDQWIWPLTPVLEKKQVWSK